MEGLDIQAIVRQAIEAYKAADQSQGPSYAEELAEEVRRHRQLERKLNEVVKENSRARDTAAEAERVSAIRGELARALEDLAKIAWLAFQPELNLDEVKRLASRPRRMPEDFAEATGREACRT